MKVYLIAGEMSGDYIGSKIINNIKSTRPDTEFCGIGGDKMIAEGFKSLFPMSQISLFGLVEIIPHIFKLRKLINQTAEDIVRQKPKILVTIDSPGFCFRVAEKVKKMAPEIIRIHVVAPSVWAYKPERAIKVAGLYNHLLTLLPFEAPLFERYGLKTSYIGHPIFEQEMPSNQEVEEFKIAYDLSQDVIAITPGSRAGEIKKHLPIFVQSILASNLDHCKCLIVSSNKEHQSIIEKIMSKHNLQYIITDQKLLAFKSAKLALAKSGTNTLEIAACNTAMIVGYKLNFLTWWYLKRFIKIDYASLINIAANRLIIPEYLQDRFTVENIADSLTRIFSSPALRKKQTSESLKVIQQMGFGKNLSSSQNAAKIIESYY